MVAVLGWSLTQGTSIETHRIFIFKDLRHTGSFFNLQSLTKNVATLLNPRQFVYFLDNPILRFMYYRLFVDETEWLTWRHFWITPLRTRYKYKKEHMDLSQSYHSLILQILHTYYLKKFVATYPACSIPIAGCIQLRAAWCRLWAVAAAAAAAADPRGSSFSVVTEHRIGCKAESWIPNILSGLFCSSTALTLFNIQC